MEQQKSDLVPQELNLAQLYLDISSNLIIAINRDEIVTEINQKGSEILGYPKEEIINKNWFDNFIPEILRSEIRPKFHQLLEGTLRLEHYENPVLTKDGKEKIIAFHNILLRDKAGEIVGTRFGVRAINGLAQERVIL